jgi:ornithine cyclodeaminase
MSLKIRFLSQSDTIQAGVLDMKAAIDDVERAFGWLDAGEVTEVPLTPLYFDRETRRRRITMHPSWVRGTVNRAGIKWKGSNLDNPSRGMPRATALQILSDPDTGHPLAVMEASLLSAVRTGAVTGVGLRFLARRAARRLGLVGAGPISRAQLMAAQSELPGAQEIRLFDVVEKRAHALAAWAETELSLSVKVVASAGAALRGADVFLPATTVRPDEAYIPPEWVPEGAFLGNISHNDYKPETILRADKVIIDTERSLQLRTVLGQMVREETFSQEQIYALVGEVVAGRRGRESEREVIFFSCLGVSGLDVAIADRLFRAAENQDLGQMLTLWEDPLWM